MMIEMKFTPGAASTNASLRARMVWDAYVIYDRTQSSSGTIKSMPSWDQMPRDCLPQEVASQNYASNSIDGFDG